MRRLTAIFVPKRSSKSDAGSSVLSDTPATSRPSSTDNVTSPNAPSSSSKPSKPRSGFFRSLSRNNGSPSPNAGPAPEAKAKRHDMPYLTTESSASSSSGGPHTPDDDRSSLIPVEASRAHSWLRSGSPMTPNDPHSSLDTSIKLQPPILSLPQIVRDDTDDDTSSEGSSDSEAAPTSTLNRVSAVSPLAYLKALSVNGIAPQFSPPPFLHIPCCPIYPRSSNPSRILSTEESLRSLMFKKRLLRRIAVGSFSPSDTSFIAGFGTRLRAPKAPLPSLNLDDNAVKDAKHLDKYSQGLRWWVDRSCFEERMVLYVPQQSTGEIQVLRITGSDLGVAALEFSEGLEAMAGLDWTNEFSEPLSTSTVSLPPTPLATSSPSMMTSALPPPTSNKTAQPPVSASPSRNSLYKATPSPLRIQHTTTPLMSRAALPASPAASASIPTIVLSPNSPDTKPRPLSQPPAKQGVRFAEGEKKEDAVPNGYVTRIKQKREEKARFLQMERERRMHEEEKQKHEEERRKQEEEKLRWEQEREAWNRERQAIEEARKRKMYAEEVTAARARRESTRVGAIPKTSDGTPLLWDGDREREREKRGREAMPTFLRPTYDNTVQGPRRGVSESAVPHVNASRNGSPGSSRPPSIGGSAASGSVRDLSRPPSMYSTSPSSATDIHSRERRESKASKRVSIASESSQMVMQYSPQVMWGMNPAMIPPVPPMPTMPSMPMFPMMPYAVDMPLLPPTPPFMMHQFGPRKPSPQPRSHSSSPTVGTHRIPTSHSSDRVNQYSVSQPSSPNSRGGHERRASGDISDLQKSRRTNASPAQSQAQLRSRADSHDRRNHSSSSLRSPSAVTSNRVGVSGSSSSRKMDSQSTHGNGHHSSSSTRPPSVPRTHTMPMMPVPMVARSIPPVPYVTPTPVLTASRTQPAFQNLSRPSAGRRQTMIS